MPFAIRLQSRLFFSLEKRLEHLRLLRRKRRIYGPLSLPKLFNISLMTDLFYSVHENDINWSTHL